MIVCYLKRLLMNVLLKFFKNFSVLNIFCIFLLLNNCANKDIWTETQKNNLIDRCFDEGKDKGYDDLKLRELCECSTNKFIAKITFKEYEDMINNESFSLDLTNKFELIIKSVIQDCELFL